MEITIIIFIIIIIVIIDIIITIVVIIIITNKPITAYFKGQETSRTKNNEKIRLNKTIINPFFSLKFPEA